MKQIDTLKTNKNSYTCNESNQNYFMNCMENYYSKQLGCLLPWTLKDGQKKHTGNVCKGKDKFTEYKNIAMNILKPDKTKELFKEGCFTPNCKQRSWDMKDNKIAGDFLLLLPQNLKVVTRREVKLYTHVNFFAEVGGYLGLLLGESLISYIIMVSQCFRLIGQKLKEKCKKANQEPK